MTSKLWKLFHSCLTGFSLQSWCHILPNFVYLKLTYCRLNDMFYSIYTDVGDYMPSYSKSKDKKDKKDRGRDRDRDDHRDRGKDRDRDRDRDYRDRDRDRRDRGRDRDRHGDRDRDRERDGHRDRRDDRKRKSYFEKPVEEVCSTHHSVPSCRQRCRHLFFQDNWFTSLCLWI